MRKIHVISLFIIFIFIVPSSGLDATISVTYKCYVDQNYGFYRVIDTTTHNISKYVNRVLTINAGDTIIWINDADPVVSMTIVSSQGLWNDAYLKKSRQEFSYTFNQEGIYDIYIKEYPKGKQKIIVNSLITDTTPSSTPISTDTSNKEKTLYVGETWDIGNGWEITAQSIDRISVPKQAWLILSKSGNKIDDIIVSEGGTYNYGDIIELKIASVYYGEDADTITIKNVVYRPDGNEPIKGKSFILTVGETKDLGNEFAIAIGSVDNIARRAQLILSKSGNKIDDKFVSTGDIYNYDNMVTMTVQNIFFGTVIDIVKLTGSNEQPNEQSQTPKLREQPNEQSQTPKLREQPNEQMDTNVRFMVMSIITIALSILLVYILRRR